MIAEIDLTAATIYSCWAKYPAQTPRSPSRSREISLMPGARLGSGQFQSALFQARHLSIRTSPHDHHFNYPYNKHDTAYMNSFRLPQIGTTFSDIYTTGPFDRRAIQ